MISFMKRGPPKVPRFADAPKQNKPGESDQEYKRRLVSERYYVAQGETEEDIEMVSFFKQVLAADSRGVISSLALSVMVSRH
jgi:hypothetical protein